MNSAENPTGNLSGLRNPDPCYYRPLLPLLFCLAAGILASRLLPFPGVLYGFAWTAAAGAAVRIFYLAFRCRSARISPLLLFCALGAIAYAPWQAPFFPPRGAADFLGQEHVQITGTVSAPARVESHRTRCILEELVVETDAGNPLSVTGGIQTALYGDCPKIVPGDRLSVHGKLRDFRNFNNPGGFDYRRFMADRGIWGAVYTDSRYLKKLEPQQNQPGFFNRLGMFRNQVSRSIAQSAEGDAAAVLSALITGKRDRINPDLRRAFNRAGASHLLAISGLHIGIVATCCFFLFKWLLSWWQPLLLRGWAGKTAALLTVMPVLTYGLISGMSPSTQRATIMVLVFLAAFVREKPYDPANTLAAAALCILAVYPPGLFSVSFQLSFAAVSAIFFGLYLFPQSSGRPDGSVPAAARFACRVRTFVLISVFAIAGTLPLVLHYFNQASVMGVVSNLILVPWIGFGVVPAGLVSTAISAFSQSAGIWCFNIAARVLDPAISLIYAIAGLDFSAFHTVTPTALEVGCAYALAAGICLMFCRRHQVSQKAVIMVLCVLVVITAADAGYWLHRRFLQKNLRVTVLDVGLGHASMVAFPGGKTMLIDGGGFSDNRVFDVGARIVAPYLWRNKIRTLDTVILSHPDADHLNGLRYILENFRVKRVISTRLGLEKEIYGDFLNVVADREIFHPSFKTLRRKQTVGGAQVRILYPEADAAAACAKCPGANNCSIVVQVRYGGKSLLFPGDLEKCAESALLAGNAKSAASDILIAPHHGSASSSSQAFVRAVDPDTVIIPVRRRYGNLPAPSVIERYRRQECRVLRTDKHGAVRIRIDADGRTEIVPTIGG